jgi:putative ABC transport system permease protein
VGRTPILNERGSNYQLGIGIVVKLFSGDRMRGELRQTWRRFRQNRTFTISILLILTLSSSAAAIVMAMADAVIIRPLPYPETKRLAVMWEVGAQHGNIIEVSHRNYVDWRARSTSFEELAAFGSVNWGQRLTGRGEPTIVPAAAVSASFFRVLGVSPQVGRALIDSDDQKNAAPVAVISHGLRDRLFGEKATGQGERLTLNGTSFEVVGVMPREFDFPKGAQLWIPVAPQIDAASASITSEALEARWLGVLFAVGRLRTGATAVQARRELDAINAELDRRSNPPPPRTVVLTPFEERALGNARPALVLLFAAVAFLILIACTNVATLLLMRASRTRTETAIRLSLGAASRHLYQTWLSEGMVLYLTAALAGLMLAHVSLPFVIRLAPESIYRISESRLTMPIACAVLLMMVLASLATAALVTALSSWWLTLAETLRSSGSTASSRLRGVRRALVTVEVAVACVLLVGAGLTIRSFINLRALDLGFTPGGVLTLDVSPSRDHGPGVNRTFYAPLIERLTALPDVIDAGAVFLRPLAFEAIGSDTRVLPDGNSVGDDDAWRRLAVPANKESATPGYFGAMRIRVLDGRDFSATDDETQPLVAIISESAARTLFPGQRAIGRRIAAAGDERGSDGTLPWRTVVGVVSDVRYRGLQDPHLDFYVPYRQTPDPVQHLVVRARGNPLDAIAQITDAVRQLDALATIEGVTTMESLVDRAMAPWRMNMVLFAVLGVLALVIAGVGLYGIVQYAVVKRWHELGIRAALGASAHRLRVMIVAEGVVLGVIGTVLGVLVAAPLVHSMTAILFDVQPGDGITFVAAAAVLVALAAAASGVPARLAGRTDPASLLRAR